MDFYTFKHNQPSGSFTATNSERKLLGNNALPIKSGIASEFTKAFEFENNIQCICARYNPEEGYHLRKMPLTPEFFVLRIDEISHSRNSLMMIDRRYKTGCVKSLSVLLLSTLEEFTFFASKNSQVKTLEILMSRRWFFSQLNIECPYGLLKKYMTVKSSKTQFDFTHTLFGNLFRKITNDANKEIPDFDSLEKRVNELLAIFFPAISSSLYDFLESEKVKISKDEINRLMNVKKYLDTDLPTPTFTSLTKIALMSATSLKTKFKRMFGITVFEYYQSMRMQRARILLLTHKYSVKQIGGQLGYSNLSNFTIAFKKEFDQLPHEVIKWH